MGTIRISNILNQKDDLNLLFMPFPDGSGIVHQMTYNAAREAKPVQQMKKEKPTGF